MTLAAALSAANSGLANIAANYALISNNVANAQTAGYAREEPVQTAVSAGALGLGVRTGPARLASAPALEAELRGISADAASADARASALDALQPKVGQVGGATDLGARVTALANSFSALLADPASATRQAAVLAAADGLAAGVRGLADAIGAARQAAQDGLVTDIGAANAALGRIGALNTRIVSLQAQGQSTADLQNQRNAELTTLNALVGVRVLPQQDGSIQLLTRNGTELPPRADALSIAPAAAGAQAYYPGGGLPGIVLNGADVTAGFASGRIGAGLALRDTTLPAYQAGLDEFAGTLATRFDAQGLRLFSDPQGNLPPAGANPVGYAAGLSLNPAIAANPALVRDGDHSVTGSPTGASAFSPNPQAQAGFTGLITRVLSFALGTEAQAGVPQPPPAASGLGPSGTLAFGGLGQGGLASLGNGFTATLGAEAGAARDTADAAGATAGSLSASLGSATGVDVDSELSRLVTLQNAYGANARIIASVNTALETILRAVS